MHNDAQSNIPTPSIIIPEQKLGAIFHINKEKSKSNNKVVLESQ